MEHRSVDVQTIHEFGDVQLCKGSQRGCYPFRLPKDVRGRRDARQVCLNLGHWIGYERKNRSTSIPHEAHKKGTRRTEVPARRDPKSKVLNDSSGKPRFSLIHG